MDQGQPRGSNSVEDWHSRFLKLLEGSHAVFRKFIACIATEHKRTGDNLVKVMLRSQVPPRQKQVVVTEKIYLMYPTRRNMSPNNFFRAITHRLMIINCPRLTCTCHCSTLYGTTRKHVVAIAKVSAGRVASTSLMKRCLHVFANASAPSWRCPQALSCKGV